MALPTKYLLFIGYTTFLAVYFTISAGIGYQTLTGSMPVYKRPYCTLGFIIIDGLLSCAWSYLQQVFLLFSWSSSVGLFNTFIFLPYFGFLIMIVLDYIRGTG